MYPWMYVNFARLMFVTHIKPDATFLCLFVPIDNVTSSILRSVITIVEEPLLKADLWRPGDWRSAVEVEGTAQEYLILLLPPPQPRTSCNSEDSDRDKDECSP